MKLDSLSFVIPAYNDAETIAAVVKSAHDIGRKAAQKLEILVINDASTDNTAEILETLKKSIPELRVMTHKVNQGYGGTVKDLYQSFKMTWMYSMPGDHQIPADQVLTLAKYADSADMIIGKRENRNDPWRRLLQSKIYNLLLKILFNLKITDVNSVRLMKQDIIQKIKLTSESAFVDAELVIDAVAAGFKVMETPIVHKPRDAKGAGGGKLSTILPTIMEMVKYRMGD